jgi:hypothetical protein
MPVVTAAVPRRYRQGKAGQAAANPPGIGMHTRTTLNVCSVALPIIAKTFNLLSRRLFVRRARISYVKIKVFMIMAIGRDARCDPMSHEPANASQVT